MQHIEHTADARADLRRQQFFKSPDWMIDSIEFEDGDLVVSGWYTSFVGHDLGLSVNGAQMSLNRYSRPDLEEVFHFLLPARRAVAFTATTKVASAPVYKFEILGASPQTFFYHYYMPEQESEFAFPDADRIERVNGIRSRSGFIRSGLTHYHIISEKLLQHCPDLGEISVLDWGCGCGSLARYFLRDRRFIYNGCDIDSDNLSWCRQHLPATAFHDLPLTPPSEPIDKLYNAIFGISVISHLSPSNIQAWSRWLALNLCPHSGILILTTLGLQAAAKCSPAILDHLLGSGVLFAEDDHPIGRIIGDSKFYGTSYQTPEYLKEVFGSEFDFVDFFQGGLGHQDMVIFRRK